MVQWLRVRSVHWKNRTFARILTLKVLVATIDAQFGGDGGCRVGKVRAGTTSPMPDHKGFKLQELVNFQKFSTLRVKQYIIIHTHTLHKKTRVVRSQP